MRLLVFTCLANIDLLYEAGAAHAEHLLPVLFKGLFRCLRVQKVLYEVVERGAHTCCKGLIHCLWRMRQVAIHAQNIPGKRFIVVFIVALELVSVGRDETDKWVPHKHELSVALHLCLL